MEFHRTDGDNAEFPAASVGPGDPDPVGMRPGVGRPRCLAGCSVGGLRVPTEGATSDVWHYSLIHGILYRLVKAKTW